jgi:hypothetical protein
VKKIAVVTPEPRQLAKRQKVIFDVTKSDVSKNAEKEKILA